MKKILFITTRNVLNTSGELRLIKNRCNTLYDNFSVETVFLVCRKNVVSNPETIDNHSPVFPFLYKKNSFIDRNKKWKKLEKHSTSLIESGNYCAVVFSGFPPASLVKNLKNKFPKIKFVYDCHGALNELKEFKPKNVLKRILKRVAYIYLNNILKKILPYMDSFFVVSNSLKEHLKNTYRINSDTFFIVPCANSNPTIDAGILLSNRKAFRKKFKIDDQDLVFVYSGGTSPWQCIDKSVAIYNKLKEHLHKNTKMFIFSNDMKYISRFKAKDIIVGTLGFDEIEKVLPMCDVAFLLRDNLVTNNVAYPNKFLEYVKSGLFVVSTPYIGDVSSQIVEYGIGTISLDSRLIADSITNKTAFGNDIEVRQRLLEDVSFKMRLESFSKYLGDHNG